MDLIQLIFLVAALACAFILLRSTRTTFVSPHDAKLFEARYSKRGLKIVALRRIGTDLDMGFGLMRRQPIRKYEIEVEGPDGTRDTRVRGVSRGEYVADRVWRYDREGRLEELR